MGAREDAKAFAAARDAQFDRVKARASEMLKSKMDIGAIVADPEGYLGSLFAILGSRVVKENAAAARMIGDKHAERF
jgi:hypothetical protein